MKSVHSGSYSFLYIPAFGGEYVEIQSIFLYSVRMRENTDQNNSEYRDFLHRVGCKNKVTQKRIYIQKRMYIQKRVYSPGKYL